MGMISMAFGATRAAEAMSQVIASSTAQMNGLAEKMLKTGVELKVAAGKEMGKGMLLDMVA